MRLARLLPKLITLEPPPCIWFIRKIQNTKNSRNGSSVISALHHGEPPVRVPVGGNALFDRVGVIRVQLLL